jgi:hypothetical protein
MFASSLPPFTGGDVIFHLACLTCRTKIDALSTTNF